MNEGGWPAWATEAVEIAEPDPRWDRRARELRGAVQQTLQPWLTAAVEHVGSTAVAGLPAKPIIDLMAPVAALEDLELVAAMVATPGWHHVPPVLDLRPWRRFFVLVEDGRRAAHLHLLRTGDQRLADMAVFRDRLRCSPRVAAEYAAMKRRLADEHRADREAYTEAKTGFVVRVVHGEGPLGL